MAKQKTFKELYKDLETIRQRIVDEQKQEDELQSNLGPALDAEIIKIIRKEYKTDTELYQLINDIQSGAVEIVFQRKTLMGDDIHE